MKYIQFFLYAAVVSLVPLTTQALSFAPDTIFLEADTPEECTELGGSYTEWYGEVYCTQASEPSVTIIPEPVDFEAQTEEAIEILATVAVIGEAETVAATNVRAVDLPFRVVERDGQPLAVTADYRPGRVNAHVANGIVIGYTVEGSVEQFGFEPVVIELPVVPVTPAPVPTPEPAQTPKESTEPPVDPEVETGEGLAVIEPPLSEATQWFVRLLTWFKFW